MNAWRRGIRNVWRAPARAVMLVAVLALAVAVFLTLGQAAQVIGARTGELAGSYQTLIEVRAAGATGMGAGADAIPAEFFQPATTIEGVEEVAPYLYQRTRDPSQPVPISIFVGMRPDDTMRVSSHGEVGDPKIVAGRRLEAGDEGRPVAVVGTVYAEQYGLQVGERLTLAPDRVLVTDRPDPDAAVEPLELEVVGIFDADFAFGNNQVFLPLQVAQDAFAQQDRITHVFAQATSAGQVDEVEAQLQDVFGDRADIISGQQFAAQFATTLDAIRTSSLVGAGIALVVAAVVIGFAMALTATERRTEVGVLKALGASRGDLTRQFLAEATTLATVGAVAGLVTFWGVGGLLGRVLLGRAAAGAAPAMTAFGESPLQAIGIGLETSLLTVLLTILGAVLLAAAGNLVPLSRTVRLQPAEAIHHD